MKVQDIMSIIKTVCSTLLAAVIAVSSMPFTASAAESENTKLIALTFDDGPNTTTTNEVLDLLEQYDAVGSFFLIGTNINDESAVSVKRAYDMGCEIDNHSKSHGNMSGMTEDEIEAEVSYVDEAVYAITGEYPHFFRPPFIDTSQIMYDTIDLPFICGLDCQDYMDNVTAEQRAQIILDNAKDGLIVLLHDAAGNYQTVDALKIVIPELKSQGYEFVTLSELFERQGETPKGDMIYTQVAKYPCADYTVFKNIFSGEVSGDSSQNVWSDAAVLDGAVLKDLGGSYAIEVECTATSAPVIALQKWSGTAIWSTVQPFYFNGDKAVFMAEDIIAALDVLGVDYTDLDRMTITPSGSPMTMTSADILIKQESDSDVSGDVNSDGSLSVADLTALNSYLLGDNVTLAAWKNGDLDLNVKLGISDLTALRALLVR